MKSPKTKPSAITSPDYLSSSMTDTVNYEGQTFDIMLHAWLSKSIGWLSPASFSLAMYDWFIHSMISPAKRADLSMKAAKEAIRLLLYTYQTQAKLPLPACAEPRATDTRFKNKLWEQFPYDLYAQIFLTCERLCDEATTRTRGVSKHHAHVVNFMTRQLLDIFSPSNFSWTNPEVVQQFFQTGGMNFVNGFSNYWEDCSRLLYELPPVGTEKYKVGKDVAVTPGKVIYRNQLIELIQYEPTTSKVYAEPMLIIPAWIMKYYILDLSPHNSLVKYLIDQGHTVFMISWKNPDGNDRDLGFDDYLNLGIMDALSVINKIMPKQPVHAVGYCLGGTLLMMAAAFMASKSDDRIKSITLFAAQVDFKEPGELSFFIDQSQITYIEDIMWEKGYLEGTQMSNAFSMLHSNDLIWSRVIRDYLLGKRRPMNDLMAWDMDTTRLPYRMHSEYLHCLFLNNELSYGRYKVGKKRISLHDITLPIFAVATVKDHVSPWKSVYKIHLFTDSEITFVLTSGGHNAGIVSEPGHKGRTYQIATSKQGDKHLTSEAWQESAASHPGSWWPAWKHWLAERSGDKVMPPQMGLSEKENPILGDAPGTYVHQK